MLKAQSAASRYGLEDQDIFDIASCLTREVAVANYEMLEFMYPKLKKFDAWSVIHESVEASNHYSLLICFSDAVGRSMEIWESRRDMPNFHVWEHHPSNYDVLRTYIWAQNDFREMVNCQAQGLLNYRTAIGQWQTAPLSTIGIRNPNPNEIDKPYGSELSPTPLEQLCDWLCEEYSPALGTMPLPNQKYTWS